MFLHLFKQLRGSDPEFLHGAIAVPRQWYSHQVLLAAGFTNLHPVPGPEQMVSMFKRGRVKLMVADNLSLPALLARGGLPAEQVARLCTAIPISPSRHRPATP